MPVNLDYETYCEADIKNGMFGYSLHPSNEILCMAYKIDNAPTQIWVPSQGPVNEAIPEIAYRAKHADTFVAWNAGFEYLETNGHAGQRIGMPKLDIGQMRDTAARAASLALPRKMEHAAKALKARIQKDTEGSRVMRQLTSPVRPTKTNGYVTRYTRQTHPHLFEVLDKYCVTDVDTEHGIGEIIGQLDPYEQAIWELDFIINARGVPVDTTMVRKVMTLRDEYLDRLVRECREICGLDPSQVGALLEWVNVNCGFTMPIADDYGTLKRLPLPSMNKEDVQAAVDSLQGSARLLLENPATPHANLAALVNHPVNLDKVKRVLDIRLQTSQTSTKKFDAIIKSKNDDERIRGMFLYWGAGPGRWAGRVVQLQNLKKPVIGTKLDKKKDGPYKGHFLNWDTSIELASAIHTYDLATLERLFAKPMDALSSIIRPAICAPEGYEFIVADYSAIEARIISWLAKEDWRLEVFRTHGKIYEATASRISGIAFESIGKDSKERQSGKVAELALGFGGSVGALIKMGAIDKYGLKYKELKPLVKSWRNANPAIQAMWHNIYQAVVTSIQHNIVIQSYGCRMGKSEDGLFFHIQLPSGRMLSYAYPRLRAVVKVFNEDHGRFELFNAAKHPVTPHQRVRINPETGAPEAYLHEGFRPSKVTEFIFEGEDSLTRQWVTQDAWYGSIVENIVQGIAACILRAGIINTEAAGYQTFLHVHDETGALVLKGQGSVKEYEDLLCALPPWAEGLPMKAEGWRGVRYHK